MNPANLLKSASNCVLAALMLTGCSATPYSNRQIEKTQLDTVATRPPQLTWTPTEAMLECVGDRIREGRALPLTVGWTLADTTGRTGVDQGMLMRSALAKVARRAGSSLRVTSMGSGPVAVGVLATAEEKLRNYSKERIQALLPPDWIFEGGVSSAPTGIRSEQVSGGADVRDASASFSRNRNIEEVRLSYALKRFHSGDDLTGAALDLRVVYQQAAISTDLGAYVAASISGRKSGAGLRFGRSSSISETAEDAIRVGIETAVAMLLADQFSIDLASCPPQSPPVPASVLASGQDADGPGKAIMTKFNGMSERERVRWAQVELTGLNYAPGPIDGLIGPATRLAVQRFEQDNRMPPSDGSVRPSVMLALARSVEIKGKGVPLTASGGVTIVPSSPVAAYRLGHRLQAHVLVPQGGWLTCFYRNPLGRVDSVFPLVTGRSTYVSARSPLQLPASLEQGTSSHPVIVLTETGTHYLYCALSRVDISSRLPAILKPGGGGDATLEMLKEEMRRKAGTDWLTDGLAQVTVVQR